MRASVAALRWLATLLLGIADRLERAAHGSPALDPAFRDSIEEHLLDLRHRLHSRYY